MNPSFILEILEIEPNILTDIQKERAYTFLRKITEIELTISEITLTDKVIKTIISKRVKDVNEDLKDLFGKNTEINLFG